MHEKCYEELVAQASMSTTMQRARTTMLVVLCSAIVHCGPLAKPGAVETGTAAPAEQRGSIGKHVPPQAGFAALVDTRKLRGTALVPLAFAVVREWAPDLLEGGGKQCGFPVQNTIEEILFVSEGKRIAVVTRWSVAGDEAEACIKKLVRAPNADVAIARIENLVVSGHPMVVRDIVRNAAALDSRSEGKTGKLGQARGATSPMGAEGLSLQSSVSLLVAEGRIDRIHLDAMVDASSNEIALVLRAELGEGAEAFAERIETLRKNAEERAKSPLAKEALGAISARAAGGLLELTVRLSGDKSHLEKLVEVIFELGRLFWVELKGPENN
jgi:hypothetical protein